MIATPIGNARDITLRALALLKSAHVIACEDTRVTSKLLAIHGISRPLTLYHEHNAVKAGPMLIRRVKNGETVALVSDAGMPLISDPGFLLVKACIEEDLLFTVLPGPSSVLAALALSGLPAEPFLFAGFAPSRAAARQKVYRQLASIPATLVFMESAQRLKSSLDDMCKILGLRQAAVCRELTKKFEEVRRGPLDQLAGYYGEKGPPKGEVTVVLAPPPTGSCSITEDELDQKILKSLVNSSVRDAAAAVALETGLPRTRVYARALSLKKNSLIS